MGLLTPFSLAQGEANWSLSAWTSHSQDTAQGPFMLESPGVGGWGGVGGGNLFKFKFLGATQDFIETHSLGVKSNHLHF